MTATCMLGDPKGYSDVQGMVTLTQTEGEQINISAQVRGLEPFTTHGFHVHQYGDITGGCESTGGHYDPDGTMHAGHSGAHKPMGDLQALTADGRGMTFMKESDNKLTLFGAKSILGRGIVLHKGDIDHTTAHNAESRIACCVIGLADDEPVASKVFT